MRCSYALSMSNEVMCVHFTAEDPTQTSRRRNAPPTVVTVMSHNSSVIWN